MAAELKILKNVYIILPPHLDVETPVEWLAAPAQLAD
ncbi:hypothetical protein BFZC1_14613 [Lysinibacillus fusiformis ZC1]|nr:hypothetical protein BFZC1_14613 [Lysinibacillus fusiformis ZC1]